MEITGTGWIRAGGLAAAAAGALFVAVQALHPDEVLASVTTPRWAAVHGLTMLMAALGLPGVAALCARQAGRAGWVGPAGGALLLVWLLLVFAFTFVEAFVLPPLAADAPRFVEAVLGLFAGRPAGVDLGALASIGPLSGALYLLGAALLGVATVRARALPRGAGALLVLAALAPVALSVLPHGGQRLAALPMGLALMWSGWALWRERRAEEGGRVARDGDGTGGTRRGA